MTRQDGFGAGVPDRHEGGVSTGGAEMPGSSAAGAGAAVRKGLRAEKAAKRRRPAAPQPNQSEDGPKRP